MRVQKILFFSIVSTVVIVILFSLFYNWRRQDWPRLRKSGVATPTTPTTPSEHPITTVNSSHKRKVVCPEHYAGPKDESATKWVTEDCDYAVPMQELVTIILMKSDHEVVSAIQKNLPGVAVIMPGDGQTSVSRSVKYVTSPKNATTGEIWNKLINASVTPYAFLASNVLNFSLNLLGLQRLVRVLSETPGTEVVGGATRNATGHWKAGCYQVELQNYVLSYQKGYHESISECMRCDHVDAPFLAEMWLLKKVPMNLKLPTEMVLPDFFLRIFRSQNSLVCPDVMLTANDLLTSPAAGNKTQWKSLARKWQLNRIHLKFPRSSILHKFKCSEVELKCQGLTQKMTKTLPVCCQEEFARVMAFWVKFANTHHINYQMMSGSLLGAIKMEDQLPWDIDGDILFDRDNFTFVASSVGKFKNAGIKLSIVTKPSAGMDFKSWGYMLMWFSGFFIELYGAPLHNEKARTRMRADPEAALGTNPFNVTKVEVHGVWITAPPNPGLYARGRYGVGILKHAMSWRHTGKKSDLDPYDAGRFRATCTDGHHACLDAMPADGSIFYNVPEY